MEARLAPVSELGPDDLERWKRLSAEAIEPNPFYEPEFVRAAAEHLGERDLQIAFVEEGDSWKASIPIEAIRWRGRIPALVAWNGPYTFHTSPLVQPAGTEVAVRALLGALEPGAAMRMVMLERTPSDGEIGAALQAITTGDRWKRVVDVRVERAILRRREDGEYLSHLRSHHRRDHRRLRRRLEELAGGAVQVIDRAGDDAAVEDFLALERDGWKGDAGTALGSDESHSEFFREICRWLHSERRLELLEMKAGDQLVAMKCNFVAGRGAFAFKIARAEAYAKFSPGIMLEIENIDRFHHSQLEWMDSCAEPDNQMINRLWTERRGLMTVGMARKGPFASVLDTAFKTGIRLRRRRPEWLNT